ncbi:MULTISPECIES: alpha/beta hydrolase family protein [Nocardiaceae]|jgi:predicted alpha/beta-hydrolase family hydrolase|uniref:alpha/beta hydrolase family protein n=1 Tax=Nocardiaceae TaxID=85025 RepID=UPI001E5493AD|nr:MULTISPECIES: alpha/beta family hydrolase [Rhodococcus]MCC8928294.1 dienelactone hydrolase family protein [Rhodococcus sp. I2R]MCZ4277705.1 alpha/beta hydrolase [Rhodococcus yunnanensis]
MPERIPPPTCVDEPGVRGFLHVPAVDPVATLAVTHGAGGDCTAKVLTDLAETWSAHGVVVLRFDMAFRRAKPSGPPHPSKAAADRESVRSAVKYLRSRGPAPMLVGGHSYGGRQASMAAAEDPDLAAGLVLLSYPLHPQGKPEKLRTAHLPEITMPVLFVSGTRDPFGTPAELCDAIDLIPAKTVFIDIPGAAHDLSAAKHRTAHRALDGAAALFRFEPGERAST